MQFIRNSFILIFLFASCGPRTIPRAKLQEIFKDAFLVNAYYDTGGATGPLDSLDMYGPILARRGYDVEDLEHTVNNFARKKSAKLSDVVEDAIEELQAEAAYYDYRLDLPRMYDSIGEAAYWREALWRDSIIAKKVADTARLRIRIPVEKGDYEVLYRYFIDSLDKNRTLLTTLSMRDSPGRRRDVETDYLTVRDSRERAVSRRLTADSLSDTLEIWLGGYPKKELKRPDMRVDSLTVIYLLPRERALDSLSGLWNNVGWYEKEVDRRAYGTHSPWRDSLAPRGARRGWEGVEPARVSRRGR